ncbi:MAG: hypothetical protein C0432_02785 [Candidatus Puniceispirillum sp.]|nr:hypothetical protein [Candidatus Pelagibacter sp.]MBA4283202.1 hypothetical protein [Candidatus Puniceispirillum sp.]
MSKSDSSFVNGIKGEQLACQFFQNKGYKIIAQRYLCPFGEIDLVIKKGSKYTAIEVKYRKKFSQLHEAISKRKLQRIQQSFSFYLQEHKIISEDIAIDVLLIYPPQRIIHVQNCHLE